MGRGLGIRWGKCPHCGEQYKVTNWMIRWVDVATGRVVAIRHQRSTVGLRRTDTHLLGCARRAG